MSVVAEVKAPIARRRKPLPVTEPEIPSFPTTEFTDVCGDRSHCVWRKFRESKASPEFFRYGMMFDVTFHTISGPKGCVGTYQGHALGGLVENVEPPPNILAYARKLFFDAVEGVFKDTITGKILNRVRMLILKDGLHSSYVP